MYVCMYVYMCVCMYVGTKFTYAANDLLKKLIYTYAKAGLASLAPNVVHFFLLSFMHMHAQCHVDRCGHKIHSI